MECGKDCPNCKQDIGIWPVVSAGLPSRIWCPHCRARLRYRIPSAVGIAMGVALAIPVVCLSLWVTGELSAAVDGAPPVEFVTRLVSFAVVALLLWVPIEVAMAFYLRNNFELTCIHVPAPSISNDLPPLETI